MIKSSNNGPFVIPTAPSAGTAVAQSASANTYGTVTQMIASTAEADYIVGFTIQATTTQVPTYVSVQLYTGAGNTVVATVTVPLPFTAGAASTQVGIQYTFRYPIPVATATKISAATASDVASAVSWKLWLICHKQADLIDAGVKEQADVQTWLANAVTVDANNAPNVSAKYWAGTAITATSIPVATAAGASGGLLISGSNSGTTTFGALTCTGSFTISDGLLVSRSTSNASAATFTGNGTGSGAVFTSGNGATGDGVQFTANSTAGNGVACVGTTTGHGFKSTAGNTGHGMALIGGATSGDGLNAVATTSGHGITATGVGTTKHGLNATGGATSSDGIRATGGGTGHGFNGVGGGSAGACGMILTATGGGAAAGALRLSAGGASSALSINQTSTGDGIGITTTSGHGINIVPAGTAKDALHLVGAAASGANAGGHGINTTGGASSATAGGTAGEGIQATGGAGSAANNGAAPGVLFQGGGTNTVASNAHGLQLLGTSTGDGLSGTSGGGATGNGATFTAASTNGAGMTLAHAGSGKDFNATTTPLTLAKTTNITGFNDIAATDVWAAATRTLTSLSGLTVDTVTTLTNLPSIPNNWLTAAGIASSALNDKGNWLLSSAYTAPDNASITTIKNKTNSLTFTQAGFVDANIQYVNDIQVKGTGTSVDPWNPV